MLLYIETSSAAFYMDTPPPPKTGSKKLLQLYALEKLLDDLDICVTVMSLDSYTNPPLSFALE